MDIFEYLPQLIVAYDGKDELANLIHVKKADKEKDYFCPCCGGIVKPRALDSSKEQSHYYHVTGKCTKESQLHFFCKNWLFEIGSKFYVDNNLFEVDSIDIEKKWITPFGNYRPDITVYTTSGETIYFEMFFSNRKTGSDYFCKWNNLGNDVVEVNIKEYMYKTDEEIIPRFSYLYHDGICHSKTYVKRDLYANTIAKIKRELTRQKVLNYKARIEQLDWFWQKIIRNENKEEILECISSMTYEDMQSCYEITKRKQCVSYLKNDVLELINQRIVFEVRKSLNLPYDENVYFDLKHINGRTYEAGIRLNLKTDHITYDDMYIHCDCYNFDRTTEYPKIVFSKNLFNIDEICIPENRIDELKRIFDKTIEYKNKILSYEKDIDDFESEDYKIKVNNNHYTVLAKIHGDYFEVLLSDYYIKEMDIDMLSEQMQSQFQNNRNKDFLESIKKSSEYLSFIDEIKLYDLYILDIGSCRSSNNLYFKLYFGKSCVYDSILQPNFEDLISKINVARDKIQYLEEKYTYANKIIGQINSCKNGFWKAKFCVEFIGPYILIKTRNKPFAHEMLYLNEDKIYSDENYFIEKVEEKMRLILIDMENYYGYRVIWEAE